MIRIPRYRRDRSERPRGFSTWTRAAGCNGESFSVSSDFRMQFRNCPTLPKPVKIIHFFIWCNTYLLRRLSFFGIIFKFVFFSSFTNNLPETVCSNHYLLLKWLAVKRNVLRVVQKNLITSWSLFRVGVNCSNCDCLTRICSTLLAANQLLDTNFIVCSNPVNPG